VVDILEKIKSPVFFSGVLNFANYLFGEKYTFTDEEMLEQFYCMLDGDSKTKPQLKNMPES
jgi:hypothetical protein